MNCDCFEKVLGFRAVAVAVAGITKKSNEYVKANSIGTGFHREFMPINFSEDPS